MYMAESVTFTQYAAGDTAKITQARVESLGRIEFAAVPAYATWSRG